MVGLLVDVTKCTGCELCVDACRLAANPNQPTDLTTIGEPLSGSQRCSIEPIDATRYARKTCMHCLEPSCVAACLVGALSKTPEGPVIYDAAKCIGCRYCMLACPYHVPRYEWDPRLPFVTKCDLCLPRLRAGGSPACVAACPNGAMRFGERQALLAEAHGLIQKEPRRYLPRVWGEHEWGGTSVLYLSDVDLSVLDFAAADASPIPALTDPLIEKTPFIGAGAAFGLWALSTIIARRNTVKASEARARQEEGHDGHH